MLGDRTVHSTRTRSLALYDPNRTSGPGPAPRNDTSESPAGVNTALLADPAAIEPEEPGSCLQARLSDRGGPGTPASGPHGELNFASEWGDRGVRDSRGR
jgi:hypothetical protein